MKTYIFNFKNTLAIIFVLFISGVAISQQKTITSDREKAYEEWRSRRFGMFIHWSPSSGRALPQSHSHARNSPLNPHGSIPAEVYDQYYKEFNPVNYNPDEWLKLAYRAGMRYAVFVAKHHDGFSLFDSKVNLYNIMATPYQKDVAGMFADACRRQGMALGWQFSPKDWRNPDYNSANHDIYNLYYASLIDELISNYGPVSVLWFDGIEPVGASKWKDTPEKIATNAYKKQPGILLGNHGGMAEDFISFEIMVGPFDREKPWETCEAVNPSGWVYNKPMPPFQFNKLLQNLVYTVSRDGNYLLDFGPMADGRLYPPDSTRLEDFAKWMKVNGEGIHGTRGGPYRDGEWGGSTCKDKSVYLFISDKVGSKLILPMLDAKILKVERLDGKKLNWSNDKKNLTLNLPDRTKTEKPAFLGVKIELDKTAFELPIIDGQLNLAFHSKVKPSGVRDNDNANYGTQLLFDNKGATAWQTSATDTLCYLDFDFEKSKTVGSLSLSEKGQTEGWNHWLQMKVKVRNSNTEKWTTILEQNSVLGAPPILSFKPIKTKFMRIEIRKQPSFVLQLAELRIFSPIEY